MKTYHFKLVICGSGEDEQEAWNDAVSSFGLDPGVPDESEIIEED